MNIAELYAEGTMRAAARILTGEFPGMAAKATLIRQRENYADIVTSALKGVLKSNIGGGLYEREWREALDANMGEPLLRAMINAHCVTAAIDAINLVAEELEV